MTIQRGAAVGGRGDTDPVLFHGLHLPQGIEHLILGFKDPAGGLVTGHARPRKRKTLAAAHEQRRTNEGLQLLHELAEGSLGHMELLRCLGKRPIFCNGDKIVILFRVHGTPYITDLV